MNGFLIEANTQTPDHQLWRFLASFISFHSFGFMVHLLSAAASGLSSTCSPAGGCIQQTSSDKLTVRFHPSAKQDAHEVKPDTCLRNWIRTKLELRESDYYYQGNSCDFEIPSESVFYSNCIYRHYPPDVISRICVMWEVSVLHKQQC